MSMPADVGEALSTYLRWARPATREPHGGCGYGGTAMTTTYGSPGGIGQRGFHHGAAGNLNLSVAANGRFVIRPDWAMLEP
jgi:hypothetical protein